MIDLHMHSTASDGSLSPADAARSARERGVTVMSLTDHDTSEGLSEASEVARSLGLRFVTGCEVTASSKDGSVVHILIYGFDPHHFEIERLLATARGGRKDRNVEIAHRLEKLGMPVDFEAITSGARGSVGRPHFARALVDRGYVRNVDEAFQRWLGDGRPAYVPRHVLSPRQVADATHAAGGLAFLAHPLVISSDPITVGRRLRDAKAEQLDGIEVVHPTHSKGETKMLRSFADQLGFLESGGSDLHNPGDPTCSIPESWVRPALDRLELL